jgi:hypothetical protein
MPPSREHESTRARERARERVAAAYTPERLTAAAGIWLQAIDPPELNAVLLSFLALMFYPWGRRLAVA